MLDIIIILVILAILGGAIAYIIKEKKAGAHCIGCPHSKTCGKKGHCSHKS